MIAQPTVKVDGDMIVVRVVKGVLAVPAGELVKVLLRDGNGYVEAVRRGKTYLRGLATARREASR